MKKITPRDIISSISRDLDIGYRGKYRYLLDKNEMAGRHSQRFIESIRKKIDSESLTSYPDQTKYYNKLSSFLSVPSDNLLLFPGSDSALKAIFESFVSQKILSLCQNQHMQWLSIMQPCMNQRCII